MHMLMVRGAALILGLLCLSCTAGGGTAATPAAPGCPTEVTLRVTQFYNWYLSAGDAYRERFQQQEPLFEPALYAELEAAFRLEPPATFLDFDPFNGAQVGSYGFRLESCRAVGRDQVVAYLLVKAGLGPERTSEQSIRLWLRDSAAGWRLDDFEYSPPTPQESYKLRPFLKRLQHSDLRGAERSVSDVLLTPGFRIVLTRHCAEGTLTCDQVSYVGKDRQTGASITLTGSTVYRLCADGMTPCQFLGYVFKNGSTTYEVSDSGTLRVVQEGKVLLEEQGAWL